MTYDDLQRIPRLSEDLRRPCRHIVVARAVKTVATDLVLLIVLIRKPVQIRLLGHGLVKSGVKHCHHRHVRHDLPARVDADQVRRIVERCEVIALLDGFQHRVVDDYGGGKLLPAMHDAVADCTDLAERLDDPVPCIRQRIDHEPDRHGVIRHRRLDLYLVPARGCVCEHTFVDTDALTEPFCEHFLRAAVDQLVLERRTPTVDY